MKSTRNVTIKVNDDSRAFLSLCNRLREDDVLRGLARPQSPEIGEGQLGAVSDALVVALGTGGAITAFVRTIPVWLKTQRAGTRITVELEDRTVHIECDNAQEARKMLERLLDSD